MNPNLANKIYTPIIITIMTRTLKKHREQIQDTIELKQPQTLVQSPQQQSQIPLKHLPHPLQIQQHILQHVPCDEFSSSSIRISSPSFIVDGLYREKQN